jgi:single-stranded-DNA-specific exonuclease
MRQTQSDAVSKSSSNRLRPSRFPAQRWVIAEPQTRQAERLAQTIALSPLLAQVLINRGVGTPDLACTFLNPELEQLPSPLEEFTDLPIALELLLNAIANRHAIAICGDYDADGMTSTALLLRALRFLGAQIDYAIPSRMQEGYGINQRIVEDFYRDGVRLILTVDNGIAAHAPIARARELGLAVIVTDHHDLPPTLPNANAILNPKLIREDSPYRGVAGVGVAYILAVCLAQCLKQTQDLTAPLIELFTLGTIADLAPLTGVNRRWVRRGLSLLPKSRLTGVQALIQVAGLSHEQSSLKPEAIGFRLGPRINAVGRIADPQLIIELLTTNDDGRALELAMKCEQVNQLRQRLCELIEQEAIAWCEETKVDVQEDRVLVVVQPGWHHGVIGIVASRLVERYGVPVFIGTYEEDDPSHIRGSARGIPEFDVFEALQCCSDLMDKFGGHRAAGGFSFKAEKLAEVRSRLRIFAAMHLQPHHLKPLVKIDVQASLSQLTLDLYQQIDHLHPCGMENSDPVFWTPNVRVLEQQVMGRDQTHMKLTVAQIAADGSMDGRAMKAIAWRWGEYYPLPNLLDIAYRLRVNEWNGSKSVELELLGVRLPTQTSPDAELPLLNNLVAVTDSLHDSTAIASSNRVSTNHVETNGNLTHALADDDTHDVKSTASVSHIVQSNHIHSEIVQTNSKRTIFEHIDEAEPSDTSLQKADFYFNKRKYTCSISGVGLTKELRIRNVEGQVLAIQPQQKRGLLGKRREDAEEIDVSQPFYFNLVRAALSALELTEKDDLLKKKDQLILEKDQQIVNLHQQIDVLQQHVNGLSAEQQQQLHNLQTDSNERTVAIQTQEVQISDLQTKLNQTTANLDPETLKRELKAQLGDAIWYCLDQRTQKDLYIAYKHRTLIQMETFTASVVDYSEAGLRLGFAAEREVAQPFFKALHQFLLTHNGLEKIGGVQLRSKKKYTLGMLPPLLSAQWSSLRDDALTCNNPTINTDLYCTVSWNQVSESDRLQVKTFLQTWEHPLATWLLNGETAASTIAQISKLHTIASHAEHFLYEWQFDLLHELVISNGQRRGVLLDIYSATNGTQV